MNRLQRETAALARQRVLKRLADAAVAAALVAVLALVGWRWYAVNTTQRLAAIASAPQQAQPSNRLEHLALAIGQARQGNDEAALAAYRQVEAEGEDALSRIARFNTANLYLRQAISLTDGNDAAAAVPLIELAKALYRQQLAQDAGAWDVRYNLEQAIRLRPEEQPDEADEGVAPMQSERAASTLRARSQGLP